jgi:hypothetical protein
MREQSGGEDVATDERRSITMMPFWMKRWFRRDPVPREILAEDLKHVDYVKKLAWSTGDDDIAKSMDHLAYRLKEGFVRDCSYSGPPEGRSEFNRRLRFPFSRVPHNPWIDTKIDR